MGTCVVTPIEKDATILDISKMKWTKILQETVTESYLDAHEDLKYATSPEDLIDGGSNAERPRHAEMARHADGNWQHTKWISESTDVRAVKKNGEIRIHAVREDSSVEEEGHSLEDVLKDPKLQYLAKLINDMAYTIIRAETDISRA